MDELYSFISKKKPNFFNSFTSRYSRKIDGYDISYDKNPETIQKIVDSSQKAKQYYSDGYNGYFNLDYHENKYKSLNNKSQTHNVERLN